MSPPHSSGTEPEPRRPSRRTVVAAVVAVVALVVGGVVVLALSGDDGPQTGSGGGGDTAAAETEERERAVAVRTRVVRVAGSLRPAAKRRVVREVREVVERFVTDAYVEGRTGFPGFTDRARRLARKDAAVTTSRRLSGGEAVGFRSGRARLSVLSTRPRAPVGVTAAVRFVLDAEGSPRPVTVQGRLLLTPAPKGWRVFGYDLAAASPPGSGGTGQQTEQDGKG